MTIGDLLKEYRLNMGLTLSEMAAGVLSTSYYAKVEKDQHRITATDLFDLLASHAIPLDDFLNHYLQTPHSFKKDMEALITLHYQGDLAGIKKIMAAYRKLDTEKAQTIIALGESCLYDLDQGRAISETSKDLIKEKLFSLPNWNLYKLSIYANFVSLYDIPSNQVFVSAILSKNLDQYNKGEREVIGVILLNFIEVLLDQGELALASYYLDQTQKVLVTRPEQLYYHVVMHFYKSLVRYLQGHDPDHLAQCQAQLNFLKTNGYTQEADSLAAFLEKNSLEKNSG